MPPVPPGQKKKKKGHAPAHQNKFAFRHNPKSKTTAKILASPNVHVCRRCHDKIEWRKQYRKYKPLTQPGTCNICSKRNVKAAYHTICEPCTRDSDKAREIIAAETAVTADETNNEPQEIPTSDDPVPAAPVSVSASGNLKLRVCAICVKELALPDADEKEDDDDIAMADKMGRIKLRELKTLERQLEREAKEARRARRHTADNEEDDENSRKEGTNDDSDADSLGEDIDDSDDEEDPFLKAVGGADKLLTGKAYQEKLLAEQRI